MRITRAAVLAGVVLLSIAATAAPAAAHITIPDPGEKGGFSIVTFSVPNEQEDAGTTKIEVQLPEEYPFPFVSVQPKPGWTAETTMRTLDEPVDAFGEPVSEVVATVTWTGGTIAPGQFDTFALSVGVLPDDVDEVAFPTIQTYSSGEEVAWIEPTPAGGEEPEHPVPVMRLVDPAAGTDGEEATTTTTVAEDDETASPAAEESDDDDSDPIAVAALIVGVIAVLLAGAAFMTARRANVPPS